MTKERVKTRRLLPGVTMHPGNNTIQINVMWGQEGWVVAYPVIPDPIEPGTPWPSSYRPGHVPQWATKPIGEFLNELADEYELDHIFSTYIKRTKE